VTDRRGVAFFDVDETLVSVRTLESFLLYYLRLVPSMISQERLRDLAAQVVRLDRAEFNRLYFSVWAGQPEDAVREAGRRWYAETSAEPGFYRPNLLERLRRHQADGDEVVLVSGSFDAPLRPLADDLGIETLYRTELETEGGLYTGRIARPMIGDDKKRAVEAYLDRFPSDAESWGYGDHSSDLPLLESVRHPVVVGSDPVMLDVAEERGWPVMPIEGDLAPRA
jgi:HAD superfamily hydrolase (TIGR01490 family)